MRRNKLLIPLAAAAALALAAYAAFHVLPRFIAIEGGPEVGVEGGAAPGRAAPAPGEPRAAPEALPRPRDDGSGPSTGLSLAVRLLDPGGEPAAGAGVWFAPEAPVNPKARPVRLEEELLEAVLEREDAEPETVRVGTGTYRAGGLIPGEGIVLARAVGHAPIRTRVLLPRDAPLELRLEPALAIAGRVRDAAGETIAGAVVILLDHGFPEGSWEAQSDSDGRFAIEGLAPGAHTLQVSAQGFAPSRLDGIAAGRADVEVILERAAVIRGRVLRSEDRNPLAGAVVRAISKDSFADDRTDAGGRFALAGLPAGAAILEIDHPECVPLRRDDLILAAGEDLDLGDVETAPGARAVIEAVDERGAPVAGARITLAWGRELFADPLYHLPLARTGSTDSNGRIELRGLLAGEHAISAEAAGFFGVKPETVEVPPVPGSVSAARVTLLRTGTIRGRVTDPEGEPVGGAKVEVEGGGEKSIRSDAAGHFFIDGVKSGKQTLAVEKAGFVRVRGFPAEAVVEEPLELVIALERGWTIRGRVVDELDRPVEEATVEVSTAPAGYFFTDRDGRFAAGLLPRGAYRLSASAHGFLDHHEIEEIELPSPEDDGDLGGIVIKLRAGLVIDGRILDAERRPLPGARVAVALPESGSLAVGHLPRIEHTGAASGPEGEFRIAGLLPGIAGILVTRDGYAPQALPTVPIPSSGLEILLEPAAQISGRVTSPGGAPVRRFRLNAEPAGGIPRGMERHAELFRRSGEFISAEGEFRLELPPGEYGLAAIAGGLATARPVEVALAAGERREGIVLALERAARLSGVVIDAATSLPPRARARVSVDVEAGSGIRESRRVECDGEGRFSFPDLPPGRAALAAEGDGGPGAALEVDLLPGAVVDGIVLECPPGGRIRGRVRRDGVPAAGVAVTARPLEGVEGSSPRAPRGGGGLTGADGGFRIASLPAGSYRLAAEMGDRAFPGPTVAVRGGETAEAVIDIASGALLRGRIASGGAPVAPAQVWVTCGDPPLRCAWAATGPDGSYELSDLPPGRALLELLPGGREGAVRLGIVEVPEGGEAARDFELPGGELALLAIDAAGRPVAGALVLLWPSGGGGAAPAASGKTNELGLLRMGYLTTGAHVAAAFHPGHGLGIAEPRALAGTPASFEALRLPPAGSIEAVVADADGNPVPGAGIAIADGRGADLVPVLAAFAGGKEPVTGPMGGLRVNHLPPGPYRVSARLGAARTSFAEAAVAPGATSRIELRLPSSPGR